MLEQFRNAAGSARLRSLSLVVISTLFGASCASENVTPTSDVSSDAPTIGSTGDASPLDPSAPVLASVTYTGIPYGPFGLWQLNKLLYGPAPFTGSHNYINADTLILQINAARNKGHRLMTAMTGGRTEKYTTNGNFDLAKWKAVMNTYNKSALKTAVAAAVSDGTLIGNSLVDEPETKKWGTTLTKGMIDQMAAYAKNIFPTLPMGVDHGPTGAQWRTTEKYTKLDYVVYQYAWWITKGNLGSWRDAALARAKLDGVKPAFSINVINGGVQDKGDGYYDCVGPGMAGKGTRYPLCRMTPDQIKTWGKALTPLGCAMLLWWYDTPWKSYYTNTANNAAFKELATLAASKPKPSCKKPT
jgi:hypothetical protein